MPAIEANERYHPATEPSDRWSRQLQAIQRIGARLTRLSSVEDVGLALCTEAKRVIDYHSCRVYVLDSQGIELVPVALTGGELYQGQAVEALRCRASDVGEGLTGWVAARGESLIVSDAAADPRALDIPGTDTVDESMLLAPLRYEDRVTGVIVLSKLGLDQFGEDDLRLLEIIADQAAVALENARLLAGREQLVLELQTLLDISQGGPEGATEMDLAALIAPKFCLAGGFDSCVISRWEEGSTLLRTVGSAGTDGLDSGYDIRDFPATRDVLRNDRLVVIQEDDSGADRAERDLMRSFGDSTLAMLPLRAGGRVIGLVELSTKGRRRDLTSYELSFCQAMSNQAGAVLETARLVEQLRLAADVDQVTGVGSHRFLQERLVQEVARSARTGASLSVMMIDLDGFKGVNDQFGHLNGDRVLRDVAATLKIAVRANDIVARYGGDEFVVLMPDTAAEQARVVARRVVHEIRERIHQMSSGEEVRLSASAGMAVYPEDARQPGTLLRAADAAMYTVKRAGGSDVRRTGQSRRRTQDRPPGAVDRRAGPPGADRRAGPPGATDRRAGAPSAAPSAPPSAPPSAASGEAR
ncbi:hypothetical protein BH20CHL6_BH20CHL6_09200 [soil metagenome]